MQSHPYQRSAHSSDQIPQQRPAQAHMNMASRSASFDRRTRSDGESALYLVMGL
jgi:hypothetical protein